MFKEEDNEIDFDRLWGFLYAKHFTKEINYNPEVSENVVDKASEGPDAPCTISADESEKSVLSYFNT